MVKSFDPEGHCDCQRDNTASLGDHNIHSFSLHAPPPSANKFQVRWNSAAPHAHKACVSVAPYLRKFGNLSIREILVITWPYVRLSAYPLSKQPCQLGVHRVRVSNTQQHIYTQTWVKYLPPPPLPAKLILPQCNELMNKALTMIDVLMTSAFVNHLIKTMVMM